MPLSHSQFFLWIILIVIWCPLCETLHHHLTTHLYDIAMRTPDARALITTLDHLHTVAQHMGLCLNADKTEFYEWTQHHIPATVTWQKTNAGCPAIHLDLAYEDTAWDMVAT